MKGKKRQKEVFLYILFLTVVATPTPRWTPNGRQLITTVQVKGDRIVSEIVSDW